MNMFKRSNVDESLINSIEETKKSISKVQALLDENQTKLTKAIEKKEIKKIGSLMIEKEELNKELEEHNHKLAELNNQLPNQVDLKSLGEIDAKWVLAGLGYEKKEVYSRISELRTAIQNCYAKMKSMEREIKCDFDELFHVQGEHARNHQFPQRNRLVSFKYLETKEIASHCLEHDNAIAEMQSDFDKLSPIVKELFEKLAEL